MKKLMSALDSVDVTYLDIRVLVEPQGIDSVKGRAFLCLELLSCKPESPEEEPSSPSNAIKYGQY